MRWGVFIFLILAYSCNSSSPGLIGLNKMKLICWDVIQADELASYKKQNDTSINLQRQSFNLYQEVFSIHQVTGEQFYKSYRYYQERPQLYKQLTDSIKAVADRQRQSKQGLVPVN